METKAKDVNRVDPGKLDPEFGDSGQIRPNFQSGSVRAVALSDEGVLTYAVWQGEGFTLYRTDPDGIPDQGFGNGGNTGKWQFVDGENARPSCLLLQADHKILLIGDTRKPDHSSQAALTRWNANGSPDLVFGRVVLPVPHNGYVLMHTMVGGCLQADGKILVTFGYLIGSSRRSVLIRLKNNGELDTDFAGTGVVEVGSESDAIQLVSVVIQDGKIIVGGRASDQLVLARYDMAGKIDTDFGVNGFAFFKTTDGFELSMTQLIAQADGKLVCAGASLEGGDTKGMVMKFTADGSADMQFNRGLPVLTDAGRLSHWYSMALQPDGKIVVVGYNYDRAAIVGRILPIGAHDTSFGGTGWVSVGIGGIARSVKVQSSARIIVGGGAMIDNGFDSPVVYGLQA